MHGLCLESLQEVVKADSSILDVGFGSGYLCACFAALGVGVHVVGVELVDELVLRAVENLSKNHSSLLKSGRITLFKGDGYEGWPSLAPYAAIHVGAAAPSVPQALLAQLAPGGRLIIPIGASSFGQELVQYDKALAGGGITSQILAGVRYVPLVHAAQ